LKKYLKENPREDDDKLSFEEMSFCREYVTIMFKLLRSETQECAWKNVRALQELEEFADKKGKIVFVEAKLIQKTRGLDK